MSLNTQLIPRKNYQLYGMFSFPLQTFSAALHMASGMGHLQVVDRLLKAGVHPDVQKEVGMDIHVYCLRAHIYCVSL